MTRDKYLITAIFLVAVMFSAGGAAAMSVIAETQTISNAEYPVCTAPCECISEYEAATRWGAEGYETCSKSICGQTADAMLQFYCIHQKGAGSALTGMTAAPTTPPEQTQVMVSPEPPGTPETTETVILITPLSTPPAAIATKQSPAGAVVIPALIGAVLLAVCGKRKE